MRASSSRPTSSSVRPGRSAPSAASSASAWSATAQARRSDPISPSSLTTRRSSTARRMLTSSGAAEPEASSANTFSSAAYPSTVTSCDSKPTRVALPCTARRASAATVARSTSSSTSGTWMPAWVV